MRYTFNFWNCLCKMVDAFVIVYVPLRLFPLRRATWSRPAVFGVSLLILSLIAYGADFFFYEVPFQQTLILLVSIGLAYACIALKGRFDMKAIVIGACVAATMLIRFAC